MADSVTRTGSLWSAHVADLAALGEKARLRSLAPRRGVDFALERLPRDVLVAPLAAAVQDAIGRGVPLGSGGSRLLRGNDPEHELLEEEAARFFGSESALFFSAGYAANVALLSTLPQRGDLIVYDELIHASMHEGLRLTRATAVSAAHNYPQSFDDAAREWRAQGNTGRIWLAFETLYSMDGDMADVAAMAQVAERHHAIMLIDEAHATGVFGPDGRGIAATLDGRSDTIVLRTCGKAMGCEGALVLAPKVVRDFLVNRGRPFIFSTAPSPLVCAAVREAMRIMADEPQRREALRALVAHAESVLAPHGALPTGSQILPLVLHEDARTMAVASALQAKGFDVRGIRPPTVPQGTSRLRISLTLNATAEGVDALGAALSEALR